MNSSRGALFLAYSMMQHKKPFEPQQKKQNTTQLPRYHSSMKRATHAAHVRRRFSSPLALIIFTHSAAWFLNLLHPRIITAAGRVNKKK